MLPLLWGGASDEVVEDMEVALPGRRSGYAVPLKVVVESFDAGQPTPFAELQLGVFSEPRCVGIEECACVSEGL